LEVNALDFKRYVVHDFLIGQPIFIDRLEKTVRFYKHNIYGQIYNLKDPEHHVIGAAKINGLIRRTNSGNYNFSNSFSVDGYIYKYLMSPEQQDKCGSKPSIFGYDELIAETDDYTGAIQTKCEWVYENNFTPDLGDKDAERGRLLKYCRDFLSGRQDEPPTQHEVTARNAHDRDER
jgi:hypothetical protein